MPRQSLPDQFILKILLMKIVIQNIHIIILGQLRWNISLVVYLDAYHLIVLDVGLCVVELGLGDLLDVLVVLDD